MKAKKVYESISDILVGKNIEDVMQSFDSNILKPETFRKIIEALIKTGYKLVIFGGDILGDYENNDYSYQGQHIITGNAFWIEFKTEDQVESIETDYGYDDLDIEGSVQYLELEGGLLRAEINVKFLGAWRSLNEDTRYAEFTAVDKNPITLVQKVLSNFNTAEETIQDAINSEKTKW